MHAWNNYPLVRLIFPFMAGIIMAIHIDRDWFVPVIFILSQLLFGIILLLKGYYFISYSSRWLIGLWINIIFFLLGYEWTTINNEKFHSDHFRNTGSSKEYMMARVIGPVTEKPNSFKAILKVSYISDSSGWIQTKGKAVVYFEKDTAAYSINYGDVLLIRYNLNETSPPANPGEFNYKRYLANQQIYDQMYVPSDNWRILTTGICNPLHLMAYNLRDKFLDILKDKYLDADEFKVAAAILAGYDETLDPELRDAYSGAGAMHILCVSGLHVGVIYLVLSVILSFLKHHKLTRWLRVVLLIACIWVYALVTGLSPSVMRASIMITFVIIGNSMNRSKNIYNTLAASAFLLLVIEPYLITSVGFQLSYLAVLGIVSLQPIIYKAIYIKYWLPDKAWAIISVSVAAQAGTFPLAIYYFHQFPNYFIITNLVVIPLSSLIIYSGFFMVLTSMTRWISFVFAWSLKYTLLGLNHAVKFVDGLPGATTTGIYINEIECLILYGIAFILICLLIFRKKRIILFILSGIIFLVLSCTIRKISRMNQKIFVVYSVKGFRAYDFIYGEENIFLADSSLLTNQRKINYHIINHWYRRGIRNPSMAGFKEKEILSGRYDFICFKDIFIEFCGKRFCLADNTADFIIGKEKTRIDYLILSENAAISIADLNDIFDFKMVVFDASNSKWKIKKWEDECRVLGIRYHSVPGSGAFVCEFED